MFVQKPIITKFEYARIRGIRLQQLQDGMKPYVESTASDSLSDIFDRELKEQKLPFKIVRQVGFNKTIAIPVSEMNLNKFN